MKTLNQLKNQFGEILSREELKNVLGGSMPVDPIAECDCPKKRNVCNGSTKCAVSDNKYHCGDGNWKDCPEEED